LESAAGQAGVMEPSARTLYASLRATADLPGHLQILPAHGAGSACGKALGAISFAAVVTGLTQAAKAASEDAIAQNKLALQLRTSTKATDGQIAAVEKDITAMSKLTGIADDQLRPALANAARATGDITRAQQLLAIGLDAAAATGKPLATVMNALEKAENGNTTALYKLAPQLKATKGGIDDFAASVKGAAEVSASPFAKFTVALDEAKEVIGAAFLPILEKLIVTLSPLIEKIAPVLAKLIEALAPIFVKLVEALLPLIEAILPPLVELLEALMPVIIPLVEILTELLVPIIRVVVQVFKFLLGAIKPIIGFIGQLVTGMKQQFAGFGNFFKGIINGWLTLVQSFINFFINGINDLIKTANKGLGFLGDLIGQKLTVSLLGKVTIPKLAKGGIVTPSPGGSIVNVAEAGEAEAIIPLSKLGNIGGGGNTYVININKATLTGEEVVQAIRRYEVSKGRSAF
jgi:phage-related protein